MKERISSSEIPPHQKKLEKFRCPGGLIEVLDVEPRMLKTPVPTLVIPGWGETLRTLERSIEILADAHRRVLAIEQPRWGPVQSPEGESSELYPRHEFTKALNVLEVLKQKGVDKADVVAHSEGAIIAAIAASIAPDQFRSLVLVAPGGMTGKESPTDVTRESINTVIDFLKRMVTDREAKQYFFTSAKETIKSVLKNPKRAIIEQAEARFKSDIHEILRMLHDQGVKTAIIHGVNDSAFPMDKIQSVAKQDQLDGFYSVKGDHFEIYAQPEKYTALADEALTALEAKLKKESVGNENTQKL